jgi:hypothetical protein
MTNPDEDFPGIDQDLDFEPETSDIEAPRADSVEQAIPANPALVRAAPRMAFEAGEYDAIEQSRVVDFDEDY